ncbi:MAG TPA: DUF4142 domain-containing protein [Fimbriiglobus sp.]|jgi:putative membrane protein
MTLQRYVTFLFAATIGLAVSRPASADDDKKNDKPLDNKTFVEKAAGGGMAEVEMAKAAQTQAQNAAVKKFADRMVKDHTAINEELKTIAAGIPVTVPERLSDKCRDEIAAMQKLTGAAFDKAYMEQQVKAHQEAVDCFKKAGKEVSNMRLKEFIIKTLPTLEDHLKRAKKVRDQVQ